MPPSVSITTVLYNSATHLKACFSSIEKNVRDGMAELIVVDNASPDNSSEIVKENFPFAKLIVSEKNLGFSGGCNLSWSQVSGRYWLLLNPDTVFPENGLENFINWMDEHPEIGVASSDIVISNGKSERPGRSFPSILLTFLEFSRLHLLLPKNFRSKLFHGTYWIDGDQLDADWVTGTVMILRREVVEKVGLLSESFFMYGEDMEWCWRIKRAGWKIGVCNSVKVLHHGSTSAKQTWGDEETNLRKQQAVYQVVKKMKGSFYVKILLLADSIAQLPEIIHPFRTKETKLIAKKRFSTNLLILQNKI